MLPKWDCWKAFFGCQSSGLTWRYMSAKRKQIATKLHLFLTSLLLEFNYRAVWTPDISHSRKNPLQTHFSSPYSLELWQRDKCKHTEFWKVMGTLWLLLWYLQDIMIFTSKTALSVSEGLFIPLKASPAFLPTAFLLRNKSRCFTPSWYFKC